MEEQMKRPILLLASLSLVILLAACNAYGNTPAQPTTAATQAGPTGSLDVITVNVVDNPTIGKILVNSQGMTLYLYTKDTPNTSNCYDQCATNWPPLIVTGTPTGGADIDSAKLGTTKRTDGTLQVTYNSWPLYTYISDQTPGDTTGQNVGSVWFVISPAGEQISENSTNGAAVVESKGQSISISGFAFSPADLTVHVGDTITWTNADAAPHTITADDGSFASEDLNKGGTFSFTFSKEGIYSYFCANHASMKGTITVVP